MLVNGKAIESWMDTIMTYPFNILGRFPVISIPVGLSHLQVPIGMQIVGPVMEDRIPYAIATSYEAVTPWLFDAPPMA